MFKGKIDNDPEELIRQFSNAHGMSGFELQISGYGIAAINIGIPMRYIHSHHGVMAKKYYELTLKLLLEIVKGSIFFKNFYKQFE